MTTELRNRLIFGPLFAGLVTAVVAIDLTTGTHFGIAALGALTMILGSREYVRLARSLAPDLRLAPVLIANLVLVLLPLWSTLPGLAGCSSTDTVAVVLGLFLGWALLEQMFRRGPEGIFAHVGAAVLGVIYLGIPFLLLHRLGELPNGGQFLLVFIAAVKLGDVSAFFGGRTFGRHKMCPTISPGKTWEGFAASFVGAIGGSYLFAWLPSCWGSVSPFDGWWQPAMWGLVLGPLGVLGDLAESCLKRAAGAKDSGSSMPGFGGVLDILDALIIAAPAAYLLARIL
jgi:phosphatidate cytidylyltransferase